MTNRRAFVGLVDYRAKIAEFEQHIRDGLPLDDLEDADDLRARLAALDHA